MPLSSPRAKARSGAGPAAYGLELAAFVAYVFCDGLVGREDGHLLDDLLPRVVDERLLVSVHERVHGDLHRVGGGDEVRSTLPTEVSSPLRTPSNGSP